MSGLPGDEARVSVAVKASAEEAFRVFTEEIDQWWRNGLRYRIGPLGRSVLHIEPKVGGRFFESIRTKAGETRVIETGRVLDFDPPRRLLFEWRATNFAPSEKTEVEVLFRPQGKTTLVTVCHRGWSSIRPDHPVRHGEDVPAFIRVMGLWWGDLMSSLRERLDPDPPATAWRR